MPRDFIEKKTEARPGYALGITLSNKETKGDVGLEIEVEGSNLLYEDDVPNPWGYHVDHSLRGEENAEYVLKKPIEFDKVSEALDILFDKLKARGAKFDDSNRTSVHVHINAQGFHLNRLTAFMALWYALEEPLVAWCGEHREGNLFCLRAVDAPAIITHMRKFIQSDGEYPIHDMLRYAALNPHSLAKFGSLEARTLQFSADRKVILAWVEILQRITELSKEFPDPREAVALFSVGGPIAYFNHILGEKAALIRSGINWTDEQLSASMRRGIRIAQSLCYCRDWSLYSPLEIKPCPFGRSMKKLVPKITAEMMQEEPVMAEPAVPTGSVNLANAMQAYMETQATLQTLAIQTAYPDEPTPDPFIHATDISW